MSSLSLRRRAAALALTSALAAGAAFGKPRRGRDPAPEAEPAVDPSRAAEAEFPPEYEPHAAEPREPRAAAEEHPTRQKVPSEGGMLRIPGAEFTMGHEGPLSSEPNERPAHLVVVAPFWIDRMEVTVEEMRACIDRGACKVRLGAGPDCTLGRGEPRAPVNCVPWPAADGYCRAVGKRLPTEAEWELAAGGGQRARYPWGSTPPTCAIAVTLIGNRTGAACSPRGPSPVGTHPRGDSFFGVADMGGNVEEWVADWYADRYEVHSAQPAARSPVGPAFGVAHVLRGGGWMSRPRDARVVARSWGSLNEAGPNVGFRCARD